MRLNDRGSFTAEATILVTFIFLVLFMMVKAYLFQFAFQYGRVCLDLSEPDYHVTEDNLFFDQYTAEGTLYFLEEDAQALENYDESLNYMRLIHLYMVFDECGEAIWDGVKAFKK